MSAVHAPGNAWHFIILLDSASKESGFVWQHCGSGHPAQRSFFQRSFLHASCSLQSSGHEKSFLPTNFAAATRRSSPLKVRAWRSGLYRTELGQIRALLTTSPGNALVCALEEGHTSTSSVHRQARLLNPAAGYLVSVEPHRHALKEPRPERKCCPPLRRNWNTSASPTDPLDFSHSEGDRPGKAALVRP